MTTLRVMVVMVVVHVVMVMSVDDAHCNDDEWGCCTLWLMTHAAMTMIGDAALYG